MLVDDELQELLLIVHHGVTLLFVFVSGFLYYLVVQKLDQILSQLVVSVEDRLLYALIQQLREGVSLIL